jgi:methylated-DNA-[protein]-cysteine S-methyltransferase
MKPHTILVFNSQLGWMALVVVGTTVKQLTFGHSTAAAARTAAKRWSEIRAEKTNCQLKKLVERLQAYAVGEPDNFRDIRLDPGLLSPFQLQILAQCRRVPYGSTISYADLAARAGHPGAARAVGNCMAANPIPLLIPCHRVVCSNGRIGSYSAPGGTAMKRRLLKLEGRNHQ